jgi:hypothetical protein
MGSFVYTHRQHRTRIVPSAGAHRGLEVTEIPPAAAPRGRAACISVRDVIWKLAVGSHAERPGMDAHARVGKQLLAG